MRFVTLRKLGFKETAKFAQGKIFSSRHTDCMRANRNLNKPKKFSIEICLFFSSSVSYVNKPAAQAADADPSQLKLHQKAKSTHLAKSS